MRCLTDNKSSEREKERERELFLMKYPMMLQMSAKKQMANDF